MSDTVNTRNGGTRQTEYWRGLDELADTPEFRSHMEKEFPGALGALENPVSRRNFLGLMGATVALSGLVGCRRPLAKILPYSKMPEDLLPGVPQTYASIISHAGVAEGVLVTSHEGRPTKIEGNPDHPGSLGATGKITQASILELYDPDRSKVPVHGDQESDWADFSVWLGERLNEAGRNQGAGLAFLGEATASPAVENLRRQVRERYPRSRWHEFAPVNRDEVIRGSRLAFGQAVRTQLRLDQADIVFSLDADFLNSDSNWVRQARDFARRRRVSSEKDTMNRLYMVESGFSVTGTMADHRLRLTHGQVSDMAQALAAELIRTHGFSLSGVAREILGRSSNLPPETEAWVKAAAKDLADHRGRAVVLAGNRQPAEVHALVHLLNASLGAVGPVVRYTREPHSGDETASLAALAEAIDRGNVDTLVVFGGNPAYNAPADLDFAARLEKVPHVVHLSLHRDETSAKAEWHLPLAHYLEAWGDGEAWDGTRSIQQPLIAPLYQGKSELELLAMIAGRSGSDGHQILQELYTEAWGSLGAPAKWNRSLNDGVIAGSAYAETPVILDAAAVGRAWSEMAATVVPDAASLEVVFVADDCVFDGRYANNGWLQELPDSLSKLVWDNAALVSPRTARELGLESGDLIHLSRGERKITAPVWVTPGLAEFCVHLPLGFGRTRSGRVGTGVGFSAYPLRTSDTMSAASGVRVEKAGGKYKLVTTQGHFKMEGRPLLREGTLEEYREDPHFVEEMAEVPELVTLYTDREYGYSEGNQWGMTIDLNTCIGCNACAIACQSENNVAVVGKDQVSRGREMHWIRIDRYYSGNEEDPEARHQPVPCMQCENAPCESVCPVNATSHSDSGLNQMVYNRCIGTRYCNNNCPYKVRRFNYYNWRPDMTEVDKMVMNPDVTVRMRGIMEKCTYCVQRINRKLIDAKNEGRPVRDGEIVTACQQVCPTESIVFGDINDSNSRVSKLKAEDRNYTMLEELNTRPRTTYLAKLRNPNPELEQSS